MLAACSKPATEPVSPRVRVGEVYLIPLPYQEPNPLLPGWMKQWRTNYTVRRVTEVGAQDYSFETPGGAPRFHRRPTVAMVQGLNWDRPSPGGSASTTSLTRIGAVLLLDATSFQSRTNTLALKASDGTAKRYIVGGNYYYRAPGVEPSYRVMRLLAVGKSGVLVLTPRQSFDTPPSGAQTVAALRAPQTPWMVLPLAEFERRNPTSNGFLPPTESEMRTAASGKAEIQ